MKYGVVIFPGSNCDRDTLHVASEVSGGTAVALWHKESSIPSDIDCIILPGGFSYGDYLRCGAIARFSPIMKEVIRFANDGGLVLGICNGFQILTEAGLLQGALNRNASMKFACKDVFLRVENNQTAFTSCYDFGSVIRMPIAHGEGNFVAEEATIAELEAENRVIFRYSDSAGNITDSANPNGATNNIAGIINKAGNVLGLMPHPERISEEILGGNDGLLIFKSIAENILSTVL